MNKFKTTKTIFFLALIFIGALMISCDDDDDKEDPSIVGTWELVSATSETFINGVSQGDETIDSYDKTLIFKDDGTFSTNYVTSTVNATESGTYIIEGDSLTTTLYEIENQLYTYSLSSNQLILIIEDEIDGEDSEDIILRKYTAIFKRK